VEPRLSSSDAARRLTMGLRVGIYDHLGWAVAVTASPGHEVVDRRRIELLGRGQPNAPVHHPGRGLSVTDVEQLVARVRASAARTTSASLDELVAALPGRVESVHLRALPAGFPTDMAVLLRAPYEARADAVMYREILARAAEARGWKVRFYDARTVEAAAGAGLGSDADEVLHGPRKRLGPPWTKNHRTALAATIIAR
jgi:hypothetical protein